jgi:hypothetical protein
MTLSVNSYIAGPTNSGVYLLEATPLEGASC